MSVLCLKYRWDRLTAVFSVKTFKFNFLILTPFSSSPNRNRLVLSCVLWSMFRLLRCWLGCSCLQVLVEDFQRYAIAELLEKASSPQRGRVCLGSSLPFMPCKVFSGLRSHVPCFPFLSHSERRLMLIYLFPACGEGCTYVWAAWIFSLKSSLSALSEVNAK